MQLFYVSPKNKRYIGKIFPFGIICFSFGILWLLIERSLLGNLEYYPVTGFPYEFSSSLIVNGIGSFFFGMIIGAFAIGSHDGYIYIRNEYPLAVKHLEEAIKQAEEYGFLGDISIYCKKGRLSESPRSVKKGDGFNEQNLENFLRVSTAQLKDFAGLTGNKDVHGLKVSDLCTTSSEISNYTAIAHV